MRRLNILISAYACEAGAGSEPGVGWNWVTEMARFHEVWAITRHVNRRVIEAAMAAQPELRVQWIYVDLPRWAAWWERDRRGEHPYYYQPSDYSAPSSGCRSTASSICSSRVRFWPSCIGP